MEKEESIEDARNLQNLEQCAAANLTSAEVDERNITFRPRRITQTQNYVSHFQNKTYLHENAAIEGADDDAKLENLDNLAFVQSMQQESEKIACN